MVEESLKTAFDNFAKDGKVPPNSLKDWFEEAEIIDKKTGIKEADVDNAVTDISKDEKGLGLDELKECINTLAKEKKLEAEELLERLASCQSSGAKSGKHTGVATGAKIAKDEKEK